MRIVVFIDYDNLLESQKTSGILNLVTAALFRSSLPAATGIGVCDVRIYGGWYEGTTMSLLAQELTVAITDEFPAIIRIPTAAPKPTALDAKAELAMALMEEPRHHIFSTYRKKRRPTNLRVQSRETVGCTHTACPLPVINKILKTGKCPIDGCRVTADDLVYRNEQKIVDTMLACDLVYSCQLGYDQIVLISGDDDFVPPIRTALLRGARIVRFHPKPNSQRISLPSSGSQLLEMEL